MRLALWGSLLMAAALLTGCVTPIGKYTSEDLALLPCEAGASPIFFFPIEFNASGTERYPNQWDMVAQRIRGQVRAAEERPEITDVILFIHGWNKNATSAEADYQDFLCRLHGRLRRLPEIEQTKRRGGLMVLGIFWPSTLTNEPRDPLLLKPASYFAMRDRADIVAHGGFRRLLLKLAESIQASTTSARVIGVRLSLIGHSFGGRMLVQAIGDLQEDDDLSKIVEAVQLLNVTLINAAVPESKFLRLKADVESAVTRKRDRTSPAERSERSFLFNIHSFNDSANRLLFPLASVLNEDGYGCAVGACGVSAYPTVCVPESGTVTTKPRLEAERVALSTWNIDTTTFVYDHTDIYKGRMASLISQLLYDKELQVSLPLIAVPPSVPTDLRCP